MKRRPFIVDASVLVPALMPAAKDFDDANTLAALDDPTLDVIAPSLIDLEVIYSAARRRGMTERELLGVVHRLQSITITRIDPKLEDIARWCARGLSAYDASYAALAEELDAELLSRDEQLHELMPERAIAEYTPAN